MWRIQVRSFFLFMARGSALMCLEEVIWLKQNRDICLWGVLRGKSVRFTDESSSRTNPAAAIVSEVSGAFSFLWHRARIHPLHPCRKKQETLYSHEIPAVENVCVCVCDLGCTIPLISALHTRSSMPSGRRRRSFHKVTPWWLLSASQTSGRDLQQNIYYCQAAERVSPKTYGDHDGFSGARCRRKSEGGERAKWQYWQLDETQK